MSQALSVDLTFRRDRIARPNMTMSERFAEISNQAGPLILCLCGFAGAAVAFVGLPGMEVLLIAGIMSYLIHVNRPWPGIPQDNSITQESDSCHLFCTGIDIHAGRAVWFSDSQVRTHILIIGSTGSGKTEFLLFLCATSAAMGGGFVFVDGKADVKTFWRLFAILSRLGIEENLRVLNFGTDFKKGTSTYGRSNGINPYASANKNEMTEMMISLMPQSGGDNQIFSERAGSFMRSMLFAASDLRDSGHFIISTETLTDMMQLDTFAKLENDPRLTEESRAEVRRYLNDLTGYREGANGSAQAKAEAAKYHSFSIMQFTPVFNLFNTTFKHVVRGKLSEIDMPDVIFSRRALYVMLPAIAQAPQTIKNLGKIIVQQIRSALAKALKSEVGGYRDEIIDTRITTSLTPFLCICDEYGAYAIEGFADVAAQARALGFCACFCSQDWASFKKADANGSEAERILSNTNIKIILKIEDSESTAKLVLERINKGYILQSGGTTSSNGIVDSQIESNNANYHEVTRIDPLDLYRLKNGLHYVIYNDNFFKVQAPYLADKFGPWKNTEYADIQLQVGVYAPQLEDLKKIVEINSKLQAIASGDMSGLKALSDNHEYAELYKILLETAQKTAESLSQTHRPDQVALGVVRQLFARTMQYSSTKAIRQIHSQTPKNKPEPPIKTEIKIEQPRAPAVQVEHEKRIDEATVVDNLASPRVNNYPTAKTADSLPTSPASSYVSSAKRVLTENASSNRLNQLYDRYKRSLPEEDITS